MTDYESMSDFEINKVVAKSFGLNPHIDRYSSSAVLIDRVKSVDYCNNPADAWPIIVENEIAISPNQEASMEVGMAYSTGVWTASASRVIDGEICLSSGCFIINCENPLRAAMIVFLMMQEAEQ